MILNKLFIFHLLMFSLLNAEIGITPQNDGDIIRLPVPPLTEERRKDLAKKVKQHSIFLLTTPSTSCR